MRFLLKLQEPQVLIENRERWLKLYKENKKSVRNKYRYRDTNIKLQLKRETNSKCIYCESKIGHNTPGDVEHIIPSSINEDQHFSWENLSIACTECNRRKNSYYKEGNEFLNPYTDHDIEDLIIHMGPIVGWKVGKMRAEITIKTLELSNNKRSELVCRKIEKIEETNNLLERFNSETNLMLKTLHKLSLEEMIDKRSEFSGMVRTIITAKLN